ncbi:MAG TPA: hypothetical protein VER39_17295 [Nocardioidaceae bacterium]|nr:hypothetical protein [Nocardioidaceae bacterium]
MTPSLVPAPWHLGQLHAHEQLLVLLVAFGPFVVLVAVILVLRRRADAPGASGVERPPTYEGPGGS